jgi:hypothetical protein
MITILLLIGVLLFSMIALGVARSSAGAPLHRGLSNRLRSYMFGHQHQGLMIANFAPGTHPGGRKTMVASAAIAAAFRFVEIGAAANKVQVCNAATDNPIGVVEDTASGDGDIVQVALLGGADGTRRVTCGGDVAYGAEIVSNNAGLAVAVPAGAGTYFVVGRALEAGANGQIIEFMPCVGIQRVVSG